MYYSFLLLESALQPPWGLVTDQAWYLPTPDHRKAGTGLALWLVAWPQAQGRGVGQRSLAGSTQEPSFFSTFKEG